jgi:hypothetical protein
MFTKIIKFDMKNLKKKKNERRIEKLIKSQIGSLDKTITEKTHDIIIHFFNIIVMNDASH